MDRVFAATTMATVAAGAIVDLDAVSWGPSSQQLQPMLTITASAVDSSGKTLPAQKLLLDTGSSTLAFCDAGFTDAVQDLETDNYVCAVYGSPPEVEEGFWGRFYDGPLSLPSRSGAIDIARSHYSIMQKQFEMPCISSVKHNAGVNGIFGVAFRQIDDATSQAPTDWNSGVGSCPDVTTNFVEPLMQFLNNQGGVKQMGIYWSGKIGDGEATLYLDDDATSNEHHDAKKAAAIGKAHLGEFGWIDITVESLEFDGQSFGDNIVCEPKQYRPCIMDTGTPILLLPTAVVQAMSESQSGSVSVKLTGVSSDAPVELVFDVQTLFSNNWIQASDDQFILGLPLWAYYYSVIDVTDSSISFTPQTPSNAIADVVV